MKSTEILNHLQVSINKNTLAHAGQLSKIYEHLKSIKKEVLKFDTFEIDLKFGPGEHDSFEATLKADIITFYTLNGCYTATVPKNNAFYDLFTSLLPGFNANQCNSMQLNRNLIAGVEYIPELVLNLDAINDIKIACSYTNQKELFNVNYRSVCINIIEGNQFEIVGSNGHILYKSQKYDIGYYIKPMQIIIPVEDIKKVLSTKPNAININIFYDNRTKETTFHLNNVRTTILTAHKYFNYNAVTPVYHNYLEFNKTELQKAIKLVQSAANKHTHAIKFHLNGSIELIASDLDFETESKAKIDYLIKTFPDTDIAFNAKYLNVILNSLKDKNLKMYTEGQNNRSVILKGASGAMSLLFPLMLN